ncbi:quinone oxidoreductase family protein [Streptomyces turgidiscabies]|uniref:Oxidoreductase, zinc-binding dehydrogenase family protein n=1 Tax=Streptomyces turgidiscabies (strain Car8) TaxID=698760 RepID=L7F632_STRT8|nr:MULTISPECIES: quinone oxidoreductase [Streptomyces]ELP66574.1 oxidoreductase, zinc-binding dehydrogenase family protein [Streptomyces turgidiscabies Car8]MDX3496765.1 quinone oxidoreductase [Streptomyces turgidiscabies]GAQ74129.1 quinone oxidoreductase 1 [Streptomyces turgidiscabies]
MQSIRVTRPGDPSELRLEQTELPVAGPGQALVRNTAVGVNYIDVYYRDGTYPAEPPFTPGQEAAGVVEAVGAGVSGFAPGARVAYASQLGAYAEYTVVPEDKLIPVPDGVDLTDAAAVTLQGLAAYYLTHETHPVAKGETVVVLAAAGGLGRLLVQLAAARGATVVAVASTPEKQEVARQSGAHHTFGYEQFDARVREVTDGQGAQVVYDSVGATTHLTSLRSLGRRGTLALCGLSSGPVPPLDIELLRDGGSLFLTRPTMRDYVYDARTLRAAGGAVFEHLASGVLKPLLHAALPLADAAEAHRLLEGRATTGKLLLTP